LDITQTVLMWAIGAG